MEPFVAISEEKIQLILKYRKENLDSYRAIQKKVGASRETARSYCERYLPESSKKLSSKRYRTKGKRKRIRVRTKTKKQKPVPFSDTTVEYDFLQYVRVVYKWALENNELRRGESDLLLYLYPKGVFTWTQFHTYHKIVAIYQRKTLDRFLDKGWVRVWRPKKGTEVALYIITSKSKDLCKKMHRYCTGDLELPTDRSNKLVTNTDVRINSYYIDIIKKMNKRRD